MAKTRLLPIPLGGGGGECNLQQKTATPTTSTQTVRPDAGYDGMSRVTIEGVDANIDANITPENIKDGVEILGVTGTYEGGGGQCNLDHKTITQNGFYYAGDDGYDGYSDVMVDVQGGCNLENGKTITQNGYYDAQSDGYDGFDAVDVNVLPNVGYLSVVPQVMQQTFNASSDGYDGYDTVDVAGMNLQSKTITQNGIYNAQSDDGWDGYSEVDVQVAPNLSIGDVFTPSTQQQQITAPMGTDGYNGFTIEAVDANIDPNIQAGNIKDGVTILGVTGTYTGGGSVDYNELCFTANEANCTVGMTNNGTNAPVMYYSTDNKQTWTLWDYSNITLANADDKVYFYGNNPNGFTTSMSNYSKFTTSGNIACSGNIMTLITRDGSATTIPSSFCFSYLFYQSSITSAEDLELPATTLANNCYYSMFYGCTSLVTAPVLPATTMKPSCYSNMFNGCTSLVSAPELPATTVYGSCYSYMFYGCTSLVTSPKLPSTILGDSCYKSMFYGCTSLVVPPELPATTLASSCYYEMFRGCTSLVTAPELPATTLVSNCYSNMFNRCRNLNYIKVGALSWNTTYANNWVSNVAPTGTFVKPFELVVGTGTGEIPSDSANGIPVGWTVKIGDLDKNTLCFTANHANSTIRLVKVNQFPIEIKLYTSTDGTNFTQWDGSTITLANAGSKIYMYGDNEYFAYAPRLDACNSFSLNGDISVDGDISCLLTIGGTNTIPDYCFYRLFQGASGLTSAPELPATTLGVSCYESMFVNCVNLTTAPAILPATTLADSCYKSMFGGCSSLTTTPSLPATTLSDFCYEGMFADCISLTTSPSLPATTAAYRCYCSMFYGCTSLTSAPALPATNLANGCYNDMFAGCTSLTTAPTLSVATLVTQCYIDMFRNCSNLTSIICLATDITASGCTTNWLDGVAASGTFTKSPQMTSWTTGSDGIPTGWTVVNV